MKKYIFYLAAISLLLTGCNKGKKYVGTVWYSENIKYNIERNDGGGSGNLWLTIKEENGQFICYYFDKSGKEDVFKFPVRYENDCMKGNYQGAIIEMCLTGTGSIFVNGFEVHDMNHLLEQEDKDGSYREWLVKIKDCYAKTKESCDGGETYKDFLELLQL